MICLLCKDAGDVIIYLNWAHLILSWLHIKIKIPLDGVLPNFTLQYHDVMVMQFHMCLWHIQGVMAVLQRYIPVALSYFSLLLRTIVLLSLMQSLHCRYHDKLWAWSCAWNLPKILQIVNFESPCQNDPWISTTNCAFPFLIVLPWNTATLSWLLTMTWSWQCCHATREEKEESSYSLSREDSGLFYCPGHSNWTIYNMLVPFCTKLYALPKPQCLHLPFHSHLERGRRKERGPAACTTITAVMVRSNNSAVMLLERKRKIAIAA